MNKVSSHAIINDDIDPVGVAGVGIGSIIDMSVVMSRLGARNGSNTNHTICHFITCR